MALITNISNYYKLDGNSTDSAGSNNGTDHGSIAYNSSFGIINQGAFANGSTQYITGNALNPSSFNTGLSISMWWRQSTVGFGYPFNISGGSFGDVQMGLNSSTQLFYAFGGTAGAHGQHNVTFTSLANTWYNVVITHNAGTDKLYVNGSLVSTDTGVTLTGTGSSGIGIGAGTDGGNAFTGDVDEVGIWTRELSLTDVTQLYNGGVGLQYPFTTGATLPFRTLLGVGI